MLDAKEKLIAVQCRAQERLGRPENKEILQRIAFQLIASSFYFDKEDTIARNEAEKSICSDEMRTNSVWSP